MSFLIRVLRELGKTSRNVEIGLRNWAKVDRRVYGVRMSIVVQGIED